MSNFPKVTILLSGLPTFAIWLLFYLNVHVNFLCYHKDKNDNIPAGVTEIVQFFRSSYRAWKALGTFPRIFRTFAYFNFRNIIV